jgi:hypothetical protein
MPAQPDSNASVDPILNLETRILHALCSSTVSGREREATISQLTLHTWRAPEHRVVYQALTRMRNSDAAALRAELPSIAARMGFPDVDWTEYFGRNDNADAAEIAQLVGLLATTSTGVPRQP